MPPKLKDVERQITDLAARVDPLAFRHGGDPRFEERRRAASQAAADTMRRVQTYLGASAALVLVIGLMTWVVVAQ